MQFTKANLKLKYVTGIISFNFYTNIVEKIHSVKNRWKNETNGQKKIFFSLTTNYIWMEEPLHHFDLKHYSFGSLINQETFGNATLSIVRFNFQCVGIVPSNEVVTGCNMLT